MFGDMSNDDMWQTLMRNAMNPVIPGAGGGSHVAVPADMLANLLTHPGIHGNIDIGGGGGKTTTKGSTTTTAEGGDNVAQAQTGIMQNAKASVNKDFGDAMDKLTKFFSMFGFGG
jgi:hypothetical protein